MNIEIKDEEYYIHFCREYSATSYIPTSLRQKDIVVYSSQAEAMNISPKKEKGIYAYYEESHGLELCAVSEHVKYGRIPIKGTDYDIYLGPVFPTGVNDEIVNELIKEQFLPISLKDQLEEFIRHIPVITPFQLMRHMVLVNWCINQEVVNSEEMFGIDREHDLDVKESEYDLLHEDDLVNEMHDYSTKLYDIILHGNETELNSYLFRNSENVRGGKLASSDLRQAKNQFIVVATQLVSHCALPAGVSAREAIVLSNRYIRDCEATNSISVIATLEYSMMKDFLHLCSEASVPSSISGEMLTALNYIRNHINEPIRVSDVANSINRSESYTIKLFHNELGATISATVNHYKLEEAKRLLAHSNIPLSEISSYLCFSSQSYFQNLFKKQYGITPNNYRRKKLSNS